jgi:hypothetical protein
MTIMTIVSRSTLTSSLFIAMIVGCAILLAACGDASTESSTKPSSNPDSRPSGASVTLPSDLFSSDALPGVVASMHEVKQSASAGDEVTFAAVLGGRRDPFVKGRAVAVITDVNLSTCYYGHCDAPWDACCVAKEAIVEQSGTLQIAGADGKPLSVDLREASELVAGAEIEVNGVVEQVGEGVFVVNARRIHVISLDPARWAPKEG